MTPDQASKALRKGEELDVDLDTGIAALALTIPYVFRFIDPTQTNGKAALNRFQMLASNAGLPHDHPSIAAWLTLRALRVEAGDAIRIEYDCPVAHALVAALGAVSTSNDAHIIRDDRSDENAISITNELPLANETGVVSTPAGIIRVPGSLVVNTKGSWAAARAGVDSIAKTLGRKAYDADPDAIVKLDYTRPDKHGAVEADSIHEDWTPEIAFHPDLKPHPAKLIQSATLATVEPPKMSYKPSLPRRVISSGFISDAQFEFITAAGEAHERFLPIDPNDQNSTKYRRGIFLADGTGAGKTNEILGTILDNALKGRRKAILVLAKRRHRHGFLEAWAKMGRDRRDFIFQWNLKSDHDIKSANGILVTTYSTLRAYQAEAEIYPRVEQAQRWAGRDFNGIIAFDESQEMRNAAGDEDFSRKSEISRQGLAGIALQTAFPDSRVIYASATGATDVHNLAYAVRLGMWGAETCFSDRSTFIKAFEGGGISDLEQVTLSLKSAGLYIARSLSFDGVDTRHLAVTLTPEERRVYNQAAEAWIKLWHAYQHCGTLCGLPLGDKKALREMRKDNNVSGTMPFSELNGIYESNRKTSMATLIAAFKARGVIEDAKAQIENGNAIVIQMQNTYEAQLNRAIERMQDPNDIRLEPAELISFAEKLPVHIYHLETYFDDEGEKRRRFVPKLDEDGNPVINHQAVAFRNDILAEMRGISLPLPPLDQMMLAFGPARLAEVTGRTKRLIPNKPNGDRDGATGVELEDRTEAQRLQDIEDFHDGKKPALVFSTGAGGASMSYHAKVGSKNTAKRIHYLIQLGYRADQVTQGLGRSHRSGQAQPPEIVLCSCDLPADRLYASRIVSGLFKLGALTQGHRHATSNGMFDERDCLDGPYAIQAWDDLQNDIRNDEVDGLTWEQFTADMGLSGKDAAEPNDEASDTRYQLGSVNQMINRVAALPDRRQEIIFDLLRDRIDAGIEKAIANGTFKAGPEILKASSLEIVGEKILNLDTIHKSATRILRIRKRSDLATTSFGDAYKKYLMAKRWHGHANFCKHRTTGQVALIMPGDEIYDALSRPIYTRDIITPTSTQNRLAHIVNREPWIPFADMDIAESLWNAQVAAAPQETTSYVTIVSDALLPVWTALYKASGFRSAVYRLQTDNGRKIVGRPLDPNKLPDFYSAIGESSRPEESEVDEIMAVLASGSRVAIASGSKQAHFLEGTFTGSAMTGCTLEFGSACSSHLGTALDSLPGAAPNRKVGATLNIATQAQSIKNALTSVLSACCALYVENDTAAANQINPAAAAHPVNNAAIAGSGQNTQALVA